LLLYCYREKIFQYILVIVNRLFKNKKFISIDFLEIKIIV